MDDWARPEGYTKHGPALQRCCAACSGSGVGHDRPGPVHFHIKRTRERGCRAPHLRPRTTREAGARAPSAHAVPLRLLDAAAVAQLATVDWRFTIDDARIKLKRLYTS